MSTTTELYRAYARQGGGSLIATAAEAAVACGESVRVVECGDHMMIDHHGDVTPLPRPAVADYSWIEGLDRVPHTADSAIYVPRKIEPWA